VEPPSSSHSIDAEPVIVAVAHDRAAADAFREWWERPHASLAEALTDADRLPALSPSWDHSPLTVGALRRARGLPCPDKSSVEPATNYRDTQGRAAAGGRGSARTEGVSRRCGIVRFGRHKGRSFTYRPLCRARGRCPHCAELEADRLLAGIPEGVELYATERETGREYEALTRRITRRRDDTEPGRPVEGEYLGLPTAPDCRLVVSAHADLGRPITREQVRERVLAAETSWGRVRPSQGWASAARSEPPEGFTDEGVVPDGAEPAWVRKQASRITGREPAELVALGGLDFGVTSDEQHQALRRALGVVTDAEFWRRVRRYGRRPGVSLRPALARWNAA
jgi:hypothetical protein